VLSGYIDPALAKADTENPFDFEGKTDAQIKAYIAGAVKGVPAIYSEPITYQMSDLFAIDTEYVAYAVAIKDGKVGEVAYTTFRTLRPSLTGVAKITAAELEPQTSHETLTVKLTADANATKVRLYAAPASDHAAYADNLEYIMDADDYQNYREEYTVANGVATCVVNIYHPATNYYLYASAVDGNGRAGEMVCVSLLAGLDTEYVTTIEEVIEEGSLSYKGTGDATLVVEVQEVVEDRISAVLTATAFSANVDKVWFIRFNGKINEVEAQVKEALIEYVEKNKIIGSYKIAKEDLGVKYVDGGSSWDPKYEALQSYDAQWGGDIIVMVILDTDGKVKIDSYYAAGMEVVEL
jgi:predicted lipoprotein